MVNARPMMERFGRLAGSESQRLLIISPHATDSRDQDRIHDHTGDAEQPPDDRSVRLSGRSVTVGRDAPSLLRQGVSGGARRRVSALVISVETAVISCAATNGFAIMTLSGTPFDDQSLFDPPDM
jgi:hypothetical protein